MLIELGKWQEPEANFIKRGFSKTKKNAMILSIFERLSSVNYQVVARPLTNLSNARDQTRQLKSTMTWRHTTLHSLYFCCYFLFMKKFYLSFCVFVVVLFCLTKIKHFHNNRAASWQYTRVFIENDNNCR